MEILLDTNFVITCTKQKIDFFNLTSQIVEEPLDWLIPDKVITEVKKLSEERSNKIKDRQSALLFLDLLESYVSRKEEIKIIHLTKPIVDDAIVDYCDKNPWVVLATLDKKLKSRVANRLLTIQGKKFLKIQKDINSSYS